jgi:hypothetical protein
MPPYEYNAELIKHNHNINQLREKQIRRKRRDDLLEQIAVKLDIQTKLLTELLRKL